MNHRDGIKFERIMKMYREFFGKKELDFDILYPVYEELRAYHIEDIEKAICEIVKVNKGRKDDFSPTIQALYDGLYRLGAQPNEPEGLRWLSLLNGGLPQPEAH